MSEGAAAVSLSTRRLLLRPLAAKDAEALHRAYGDPHVMRHWHTPPHDTLAQTRALLEGIGAGSAWVLVPHGGEEAVGLVYFLSGKGIAGLGYILARAAWGQGFMPEAVERVVAYGFEALGLDGIELWIHAANPASRRVAEKTGFARRGAFPQKFAHAPAAHETLVYGLKRTEWAGAAAGPDAPAEAYGLTPVLAVRDVAATAAFYRDMLGFRIEFLEGDPPVYGGVAFATFAATGARLHLTHREAPPPVEGLSLRILVDGSIDCLHERFAARGVAIAAPLTQQPWGAREFAVRDNNGYVLMFTTPA
ncbi:GNAT family N-acetyltransferase [Roseixanthobacter liquoris]|uniref:GNAT family N-acetyltransferase n=1 Tax=Roseixanthobacter liquoris TaxID=3119921 RepID=UPI00372987D8